MRIYFIYKIPQNVKQIEIYQLLQVSHKSYDSLTATKCSFCASVKDARKPFWHFGCEAKLTSAQRSGLPPGSEVPACYRPSRIISAQVLVKIPVFWNISHKVILRHSSRAVQVTISNCLAIVVVFPRGATGIGDIFGFVSRFVVFFFATTLSKEFSVGTC